MRIRRVSLLNLNSLRGEHSVDLGAEPFSGAGIFAITGPTGAGKTTILDAITLALYGRAARYGSDSNPPDMMSRHTGECWAEVSFEAEGKLYRARWGVHRSRRKPEGNLQSATRYIYDENGIEIASQVNAANEAITRITGLDHARFMRSVLLAQGEFARFLKATANERAALLESLTGTKIYSELSIAAHAEQARRDRELTAKQTAAGLIQLLDDEALAALKFETAKATSRLTKSRADQKKRETTLAAVAALAESIQEEQSLLDSQKANATRLSEAKPLLARLDLHHQATPFLPALKASEDAATRAKSYQSRAAEARSASATANNVHLESLAAALVVGDKEIAATHASLEENTAATARTTKARKAIATWISQNERDRKLAKILPDLAESVTSLANIQKSTADTAAVILALTAKQSTASKKHSAAKLAVAQAKEESATAQATATLASEEFSKAEAGRTLADRRAGLDSIKLLRSKTAALKADASRIAERTHAHAADQEKRPPAQIAVETALKNLAHTDKQVTILDRHLNDAKLHASFEAKRAALTPGDPCPLCGAAEHPYCESGPTPPSALEEELSAARTALESAKKIAAAAENQLTTITTRIAEAEKSLTSERERNTQAEQEIAILTSKIPGGETTDLGALEKREQAGLSALEASEKRVATTGETARAAAATHQQRETELTAVAAQLTDLDERLAEQQKLRETHRTSHAAQSESLAQQLNPYGLSSDAEGLINTLRKRASSWEEHEKKLDDSFAAQEKLEAQKESQSSQLKALQVRTKKLTTLIGDRDLPETTLEFASLDEAADAVGKRDREAQKCSGEARHLEAEVKAASGESARLLSDLKASLIDSPFADPGSLQQGILEATAASEAEATRRALAEENQQLTGALAECQKKLATRRAENLPEGSNLAKLHSTHAEAEEEIEALTTKRADCEASLRANEQARAKQAEMHAALAEEAAQLKTWTQLSELIGSHDGKRFRVFAQGLSLDVLLRHANDHLSRLNPRYHLGRAEGETLELDIIDLYQASARRPMSSLSGGESFLASLALALGLSDLAGRNVQIDSLFIDEGFGTLDTETLDTALSALESLRLQEKTVGIISHVDVLKERIGVQINVLRKPDGSSALEVRGG